MNPTTPHISKKHTKLVLSLILVLFFISSVNLFGQTSHETLLPITYTQQDRDRSIHMEVKIMALAPLSTALTLLNTALADLNMTRTDLNTALADLNITSTDLNMVHADLNMAHADLNMVHADLNMAHADLSMTLANMSITLADLNMACAEKSCILKRKYNSQIY